jgi:hypothetical protein
MSVSLVKRGEKDNTGLQFPYGVKDDQGQLLWETNTEMTLPDGTLFHSANQCTTRLLWTVGVWQASIPPCHRGCWVARQVVTATQWVRARPRMASVNGSSHWRSTSGECPNSFTGECPASPHWGSYPSSGYGVIEPTCHVQAVCIAVPGAASAYRLYSVDLEGGTVRCHEVYQPTFWNETAVLIFPAKPDVRAPICVCM